MVDKLGFDLVQGDVMVYPGDAPEKLHAVVQGDLAVFYHRGHKDGSFPLAYSAGKMIRMTVRPIVTEATVMVRRAVEVLSEPCESCSA